MKISVISLFRDSERHIPITFENLEALERRHDVNYFFYENDSQDDTKELLREWMHGRRGVVISENVGLERLANTRDRDRLTAMAFYRNRILAEATRIESRWTLLLDSDVVFPETIVEQYLAHEEPTVAMFTPFVEHNVECHMCDPACHRPAYYDTFALRDSRDRAGQIFSCNPFWDHADRQAWSDGHPVDVHCAFGGAALVRSDVLERCHWKSDGDCEHVVFTEQVRRRGRILAVPTVKTWTTSREHVPSPDLLRAQRELIQNPLLLRFWTARNCGVLPSTEGGGTD